MTLLNNYLWQVKIRIRSPERVASCLLTRIIMAGMAVFNVAGYLVEERRRWPVINASPRGQCSK